MRKPAKALALALLAALLLSACGAKTRLQINDRGVITTLEVSLPMSAAEILREAEIVLRPGDRLDPAPETLLREAQPITVLRENAVLLTVDGRSATVLMNGGTVAELLEREGVALGEGRHVNQPLDAWLTDGMEIRVSDSLSVTILCDGQTSVRDLEAETVGEALAVCGIFPGEDDLISPAPDTQLTDGMQIRVSRVSWRTEEREESIPFETRYERDETMPVGAERVLTAGRDGKKAVRYRICLVDGRESSREVVGEEILLEPVQAQIVRGPRDLSRVSIVSQKVFYDCDGSGHGYTETVYSDGSVEYDYF